MLVYLKTTKSVKCYATKYPTNYKYLERIINLIKLIKIYKSYYLVIQEATVLIRARSCSGPKKLLCSNLCKIVRCTYYKSVLLPVSNLIIYMITYLICTRSNCKHFLKKGHGYSNFDYHEKICVLISIKVNVKGYLPIFIWKS